MIGILCEKVSAAKNFAKALGGSKGTYNGEAYQIAASHGHLFELAQPEVQVPQALSEKYKSWDLANLPWDEKEMAWKRVKKKGADQTLKSIKETLSGCDEIAIATDVDPTGEGELLAWEILSYLQLKPKVWSRLYFADESVKEVRKAFTSRVQIRDMASDGDYNKAFFRSRFDFLTMQFTRIATLQGDGHSVLRQGRLKSAMVLIVGDQLKKLAAYQKIPYYQNRFRDENGVMYTNPEEPKYKTEAEAPRSYHASKVVCDSKTMKHTAPPKFLDLAALAARLSSKGAKAKDILDVYQRMYEDQVVSYPRTEDKCVSEEQFKELLPLIDRIADVVGVDATLLTHREPRRTHVKQGGAHGANRPGTSVPASLQAVEDKYGALGRLIYETLARNYLASLAEDYEYETQKGHLTDYPAFVGSANVPKKQGWKAVFWNEEIDKSEEDESENEKGLGITAKPFVYEGFPPKPESPTMEWLRKQLEKHDVGTGATRTSIYAEVTDESDRYPLLRDKRGRISMTEYGDMSYRLLPNTHIGSLELTEQLQRDMRDVAAGTADPEQLLSKIQQMVRDDLSAMAQNGAAMRAALGKALDTSREAAMKDASIGTCPRCGGMVVEGKKGFGCSNWKSGCKFVIWKKRDVGAFRNTTITKETAAKLLKGESVTMRKLVGKSGNEFAGIVKLKDNPASEYLGTDFEISLASLGTCPLCGNDIREGKTGYGCSNWKNGCKFILFKKPKGPMFANTTITVAQAKRLLAGGEVELNKLVSSNGTEFSAKANMQAPEPGAEYQSARLNLIFDSGEPLGKCPVCKKNDVIDKGRIYACAGENCPFRIGKDISGAAIKPADVKQLISGKKTRQIKFKWKSGKTGEAALKLKPDGALAFVFDDSGTKKPPREKY